MDFLSGAATKGTMNIAANKHLATSWPELWRAFAVQHVQAPLGTIRTFVLKVLNVSKDGR